MPRRRLLAVIASALLAGALGAWRARDLGPRLDVAVEREQATAGTAAYRVSVTSRGGEVLDEVAFQVPGPWVEIDGPRAARRLRPGVELVTTLRVREAEGPAHVDVVQRGRVARTYRIDLAERAR